jgi:hypothetical protein
MCPIGIHKKYSNVPGFLSSVVCTYERTASLSGHFYPWSKYSFKKWLNGHQTFSIMIGKISASPWGI